MSLFDLVKQHDAVPFLCFVLIAPNTRKIVNSFVKTVTYVTEILQETVNKLKIRCQNISFLQPEKKGRTIPFSFIQSRQARF